MIINTQTVKKTQGGLLPAEYQQVEYIESTGTQYIDSGFTATQYTQIDADIMVKSDTPLWYTCWGAYNDTTSKGFQFQGHAGGSVAQNVFSLTTNQASGTYAGVYDERIRMVTNINGVQVYRSSSVTNYNLQGSHSTDVSVGIFCGHNRSGSDYYIIGALLRVYRFRILNSNELVRDFIPCYRKADNKTGLYDLVNSVFYPNLGSGDEFLK